MFFYTIDGVQLRDSNTASYGFKKLCSKTWISFSSMTQFYKTLQRDYVFFSLKKLLVALSANPMVCKYTL